MKDKKKENQRSRRKETGKARKLEKKNSAAKNPKIALVIWVVIEEYSRGERGYFGRGLFWTVEI